MAAPLQECFCHLLECDKDPILPCTQVSWTKLYDSANVWASLDGVERLVAVKLLDYSEVVIPDIAGYHRRCYQRFTDLKRIRQGINRKEKGRLRPSSELPSYCEISSSEPPAKLPTLRSNFESSHSTRRSEHVLPNECIICRKCKKTVDRSTGKRKIEGLVSCETNAEKLLGAARLKDDGRILLQIGDLDPVCIEVRYHASCYKAYTKCVYDVKQTTVRPLTESFETFCAEVIEKRLVSNGEVLKITHLTKLFIDTVKDVEGLDINGYRNFQLKDRLRKKYPDLEFIQPESRCCELVLYHTADASNTLIRMPTNDHDIDSCSDTDEESELPSQHSFSQHSTQDEFAELYRVAIIVRSAIQASPSVTMWPPSANNLTQNKCFDMIPSKLFNFLAWSCGISDNFCTDRVEVSSTDAQNKLLSLSQDVIFLATQGRKLMPKHLALGMTVRHLTGSARLQNLLNAFGHCVSHSVTLEHDTALAAQQLHRETPVPHGFKPDVFTTLVWDNNDFGEETLTDRMEVGKGTTHNTNGLIIQRVTNSQPEPEELEPMSRDRKRTIDAPPPDIHNYHGQKRRGPNQFQGETLDLTRKPDVQQESIVTDRAYFLAKHCQTDALLPGWTGWNQVLHKDAHPINKIGYLPIIDASPTDKSTVNAILEKSLEITSALNLQSIVLVMDQAIYAKAQEIRWQGPEEFRDKIILRLGEFHTAMAFLGAVGKRFKDAGLLDVIVESGIVAEGSIAGVLSGHHYNRCLRTHKLICEALQRLRIQDYISQLQETEYQDALMMIENVQDDFQSKFLTAIQSDSVGTFLRSFQEYIDLRSRQNAMYAFWSSYLEMIELLLRFIRATREGNWDLHLSCVRDMIPWFFAYGRINYSRYLPVYYFEMSNLPSTHPTVYARLKDGEFAVKRHEDHGFAMTACDQVIEQTFNRDSKTRGGLTGITLNKGAVRRWILSHPARAGIANECYTMASGKSDKSSSTTTELLNSRMQTDEQAVQDVMSTISGFSNPFTFEENEDIVNISSGKVAPPNVKSELSSAFSRGEECFSSFVKERLIENQKDLYDSLTLPSCKTFSDIDRKPKSKQSLVSDSLKENRNILSRLLVIAQEKGLDLKGVMAYPLSSVPQAIAHFDGSMVKTSKATLLNELERQVPNSQLKEDAKFSQETVLIIDAMALIQQQRHFPETFGGFALSLLQQIISLAKKYGAKRVDFVGDRYPDISTKGYERHNRSAQGETRVNINRPEQKMPKQMKKFLSCGSNKEGLLKFVVDEWKGYQVHAFGETEIYATYEDRCFKIYGSENTLQCEDIVDLQSNQEEADTRMFLHAHHVSQSSQPDIDIIIRTVDTDVLVIAVWASTILANRLILLLSLGNNTRSIDVREMSRTLGNATSKALVALHPFTGCDTVSAFKGKGKVKALKLMMKDVTFQHSFMDLGKDLTISQDLHQDVEKFVCELYGWTGCLSVNDVRYNCLRFGCTGETSMPPNSDSLSLHMQRANYQAYVYRSCMLQMPRPSPAGHGWTLSDSEISIKWTTMPVAPPAVLQSVHCGCTKTTCDSSKCSCKKAGLVCTDLCRCDGCSNRELQQNSDTDSD